MDVPPGEVINNSVGGFGGAAMALCGEEMRNSPPVFSFRLLINCNVFIRYFGDATEDVFFFLNDINDFVAELQPVPHISTI